MTVAVYVTNEADASTLIPWGVRFARADHTDVLVISTKRSKGKTGWEDVRLSESEDNPLRATIYQAVASQNQQSVVLKQDIAAGVESSDLDRVAIEVREFQAPAPERAIVEELNSRLSITLLLLPIQQTGNSPSLVRDLFDHSPCEACMIQGPAPDEDQPIRILLATHGGTDIETELTRARQLTQTYHGKVTVLYVRPDDDIVAARVAHRNLDRIIREVPGPHELFETQIALQDSLLDGIHQTNLDDYDLVIIGSRRRKNVRHVIQGLLVDQEKPRRIAIATMREGVPFVSKIWSWFSELCRLKIPQLNREQRVELVDRLQTNSRFDVDFIVLISLSTLIAGLGLIRNSGAVVIGAMLVAPLMTPLVGIGFALLQGNSQLVRNAMRSLLLGFAVAFAIGAVLGLIVPTGMFEKDGHLNFELLGRCEPNLIDLVIALVSGVAGAYATGRPKLLAALPGVAIAAALVPPIATSGILFAAMEFSLSLGALLLFFANIVAIVLGTTVAFWAIGINSSARGRDDRKPDLWPQYLFFAFVIIAFLLAILLPLRNSHLDNHKKASKQNGVNAGSEVSK